MKLRVGKLDIELAPFSKADLPAYVDGWQYNSVSQYTDAHNKVYRLEDEEAWYDKVRTDTAQVIWGIWVVKGNQRKLIGNTTITSIERHPVAQGVTGIVITDKAYWGKGIASHAHRARTWYAFEQLGLVRLKSAVMHGNAASLKALQQVGYNQVYVERNVQFADGKLRHQDCLECINPAATYWQFWWGDDQPDQTALTARAKTAATLKWAKANVELP